MMMINSPTTTAPKSSEAVSGSTANKAMVHHQDPLKCPRCDSSNTKFCYYNNYSLSQPRHYCKGCKRYWTRGGTLRNVPVGGGCRKSNKRHKTHQYGTSGSKSVTAKIDPPRNLPTTTTTTTDLSSFFRSTTSLASDMGNLGSFSGLMRPVYSDIQPQLSTFGLGGLFSSTGGFSSNIVSDHIIQPSTANLLNDQYLPSFGSQAASLLVSSLKQPKMVDDYEAMLPYENLQTSSNVNLGLMKEGEVKVEGNNNTRSDQWPVITPFQAFNANNSSEITADSSSYLYWNSSAIGSGDAWPDATNPSLDPLI